MNSLSSKPVKSQPSSLRKQAATAGLFDREAELPKLIRLWPGELRDYSFVGTRKIISMLKSALRAERKRGQTGHWSYDLNRHLALAEALKAEADRLDALIRQERLRRARGPKGSVLCIKQ